MGKPIHIWDLKIVLCREVYYCVLISEGWSTIGGFSVYAKANELPMVLISTILRFRPKVFPNIHPCCTPRIARHQGVTEWAAGFMHIATTHENGTVRKLSIVCQHVSTTNCWKSSARAEVSCLHLSRLNYQSTIFYL